MKGIAYTLFVSKGIDLQIQDMRGGVISAQAGTGLVLTFRLRANFGSRVGFTFAVNREETPRKMLYGRTRDSVSQPTGAGRGEHACCSPVPFGSPGRVLPVPHLPCFFPVVRQC